MSAREGERTDGTSDLLSLPDDKDKDSFFLSLFISLSLTHTTEDNSSDLTAAVRKQTIV